MSSPISKIAYNLYIISSLLIESNAHKILQMLLLMMSVSLWFSFIFQLNSVGCSITLKLEKKISPFKALKF